MLHLHVAHAILSFSSQGRVKCGRRRFDRSSRRITMRQARVEEAKTPPRVTSPEGSKPVVENFPDDVMEKERLLLFQRAGEASSALKHTFWKMKDCNFFKMVPFHQFLCCGVSAKGCKGRQSKGKATQRLDSNIARHATAPKRHRPQCLFSVMPFALVDASKLNLCLVFVGIGACRCLLGHRHALISSIGCHQAACPS